MPTTLLQELRISRAENGLAEIHRHLKPPAVIVLVRFTRSEIVVIYRP